MVPRCTCQNASGSSSSKSSLIGVRISASPSAREHASCTCRSPGSRARRRRGSAHRVAGEARIHFRRPAVAARSEGVASQRRRGRGRRASASRASGARPSCAMRSSADRLQQVVDGLSLERLDRVLVERGDEYHVRCGPATRARRRARESRHADVEERDVGRLGLDQRAARRRRAGRRDDLQFGPARRAGGASGARASRGSSSATIAVGRRSAPSGSRRAPTVTRTRARRGSRRIVSETSLRYRTARRADRATLAEPARRSPEVADPVRGDDARDRCPRPRHHHAVVVAPASIATVPPSALGSMPCLIAFSTSGCSIVGGNATSASASRQRRRATRSRGPMRIARISRYARTCASSRRRVLDRRRTRSAKPARRSVDQRAPSSCDACGGSASVRTAPRRACCTGSAARPGPASA